MQSLGSTMRMTPSGKGAHPGFIENLCALAAVILVALSAPYEARAQTKQIKVVVPLPPGGAGDILARFLAEQVGQAHDAGIVIENRPGAGSVIGTEAVARAAPDGSTLLINAPYLLIGRRSKSLTTIR